MRASVHTWRSIGNRCLHSKGYSRGWEQAFTLEINMENRCLHQKEYHRSQEQVLWSVTDAWNGSTDHAPGCHNNWPHYQKRKHFKIQKIQTMCIIQQHTIYVPNQNKGSCLVVQWKQVCCLELSAVLACTIQHAI